MSAAIDIIREKLDIADVIGLYVKDLRQVGRNYKACCPFHNEKTPSFTVSPDKGIFYCFGCHEGGDIFTFVMKIEGITFPEAAKKLASMAGVEYSGQSRQLTREEKERAVLKKALEFAKKYYCGQLFSKEGEKARLYIGGRKVNKAMAEQFELGWAPPYGQALLDEMNKAGFSVDTAVNAGLAKKLDGGRTRDVFRGRLLFPIKDISGNTIAFGGRTLNPEAMPKYLNSPETALFHKKKTLYGLDRSMPEIRRTGRALVLEGYMDVIGAHQHGINYAVAPLGTALSAEHAAILGRSAQDIILMFDDDSAGIKASVRAAEIFMEEGMFVRIASLRDGLDPDEFLNKYGKQAFEKIIAEAEDPLEFRIRQFFRNRPNPSAQDKAGAIRILLKTVEKQQDEIVKSEWIKMLASKFDVERESVLKQLAKFSDTRKGHAANVQKKDEEEKQAQDRPIIPPLEKDILQMFIRSPELLPKSQNITEEDFSSPMAQSLYREISAMPEDNRRNLTLALADRFPDMAQLLYEMAMSETEKDKSDASAIAGAIRMLKTASLKRRMSELKKIPEMTPEQLQEYSLLAMELKASGEKQ